MLTRAESMRTRQRIQVSQSYLTPREYQVMSMYIDGRTHQQMLTELAIAPQTITNHVRSAKHRLGARTIYELIAMVARADAFRERDGYSNRDSSGARMTVRAQNCVEALTVTSRPELPRSRAL